MRKKLLVHTLQQLVVDLVAPPQDGRDVLLLALVLVDQVVVCFFRVPREQIRLLLLPHLVGDHRVEQLTDAQVHQPGEAPVDVGLEPFSCVEH